MNLDSYLVKQEISRFECVHPCIYASYDILDRMDDEELANKIREHLIAIEDAFVNSQEWTLSRSVTEVKIAFVGSPASGKSALVHFFLTGVYIHDESPEGGRFKKLCFNSIQPYLLLIRDEAGPPDFQLASWIDAIVFVVSLADIKSVQIANDYYSLLCNMRELSFVPVVIVATQDAVVNTAPPSGIEDFVRQLVNKMGRCPYYETCAVNGLNVEQVFQEVASRVFAIRSQQWSLQHTRFFASQSSGSSAATNQSGTNLKPAVDKLPISSDDIRELSHKKVVQLSAQKFGGAQLTRFSVVNGPNPEAHGQPYPTTDSRGHSLTDQWSEPVTTGPNSPASVAYTEYITGTMRPPNPINPVSCSQPHAAHITPATIMSLHPAFNRSLFPSAGQVPALHLLQPTSNLRISGSPRSMLPVQATLHSSWIYQPATLQPNSKPSADPMKSTIEPTALPVPLAALTLSESPSGHLLQSIQGSVLQTSHSPLPTELSMQLAPNQQHLGQDWTLTQRGRSDCIKESFPCLNAVIRNKAFSNTLQPKGQTMGVQFQSVPVVSNPSQASHSSQPTPSPPVSSAQMQDRRLSNVFHRPEVEISSGNPGKSSIGPVTQNVSRHSDEHKRDRPRPQSTGSLGSPLVDLTSATICTGGLHTNAVVSPKHRDNLGAGRLIPLKQGYLYKRSIKGISKETRKKKKYVVITEDARLTYHPSKQDYVNGQSSKSIDLTISTIKVPGLAYRMSSFTASTGTPESTPGSQAPAEMNSSFILPSLASSVTSTSTPKGRASEAAPNSANSPSASLWKTRVEKNGNVEFIVITANNTQWHFEAPSTAIRDEWIQQIDLVIHNRLRAGTTARISCEIGAGKSPYKGTNEEDSNPRTSHGRPLSFASPNAGDLKEGGGEDVCGQEEVLQRLTALAGNNCCADCGAPSK
ncbi:unnamed protein product [Calicophoron daubneyi]|uniref:PH domain-containing protein n=1 Tax=Calicophoron daubneyi TaxID=300641 RepID=A0AAV2THG5_CALDB